MQFTETGVMIADAFVNGVEQMDTVAVRASEVQITLQKQSMRPSIRFVNLQGVSISDLSTQKISVSVVGDSGLILNKSVSLALKATDGSAGHIGHPANSKPPGGLRTGGPTITLNTGPTGVDTVTFVAPDPSGPVTVTGTSDGARIGAAQIKVEVTGLVQLPLVDAHYDTSGYKAIHPDNHWVTPNHLGYLVGLANQFFFVTTEWYGTAKKLSFNDSSLPSGGLFDNVDNTGFWTYPHRLARDTDVRTTKDPNLIQDDLDEVRFIWVHQFGGTIKTEGDHWHLTK
jgi:hypothetical protein